MGGAARARRRELSHPAGVPLRALGVLPRQAVGGRVDSPAAPAGSPTSRELPLTEKRELRETCTAENPFGAHLCAAPSEIVRIYSTSGTTGTPELHPADRRRSRQLGDGVGAQLRGVRDRGRPADRLHLQRRARSSAGAALAAFDRIGLVPRPGRDRQHRAPDARDRAPAARRRRADPLVRRPPRRMGGRARLRPARVERRARPRGGRARRRRARLPRACSRRAGARGSPRRWASATSACRSGASARSRTGCTSARAASSTPS